MGAEKGAVVVASPGAGSIDHLLPQPVEDDAIIKEVSRIRDNIKNHAQTYYHFEAVPEVNVNGQALAEIAEGTGMSSSTLAGLLSNPATRGDAIRLVISYVALSRCEDSRFPNLLPQEIASLAVAIPRNDGNKTGMSNLADGYILKITC
jgi:lambda repressor-like predicted transcriptional regulator